jgi:ABC-type transporter Mla subunit MlaD
MNLATSLGPDAELSSSSAGRFIDSAANAMNGNGDKLRQTFAQLSRLASMLADNSGNIVDTVQNLQTFVSALHHSSDEMVQFQDRLASFSTVLNDSRSDLDSASRQISIAVGEVQRFVAASHAQASEQVQRLANVTQVLVDQRSDIENILHVAPTAFANAYNIFNPNLPGALGSFVLNNFADPISFICSAIGGLQNVTAPETAKLCANYLGPALRLMTFNYLPIPQNPLLAPVITPDKLIYPDPALVPGGPGGAPIPPETPPAVSAYTGDAPPIPLPAIAPPPETRDDLLLPAEMPPPSDGNPLP